MARWQQVKIGDICVVERGGSPRPIEKFITNDSNGINWIKIGDTTGSMYITKTAQKIIPEGAKKSRFVQSGDFLLSNSMSFGRPYILSIDGCIHDGWLVLRDKDNLFDKHYLYYCLSAPVTYTKLKSMAVGGVVNNLNSEMVRNVKIPLPPLEEQRRIAALLDKVSDLIAKRRAQLDKLDLLVKARFVEMFGDPESNPMNWPITEIGAITKTIDSGWSGNGTQREKKPGEIAVLKVSAVTKGYFIPDECKVLDDQENIKKYVFPQKGDLLLSRANTKEMVGATAIIREDYPELILPDKLWKIRFSGATNVVYMKNILSSKTIRNKFSAASTGTSGSMYNVSMEKFKAIQIPMPEIRIQNQFASFAESVEKSKLTIQQSLDKLEILKKDLMQQYIG